MMGKNARYRAKKRKYKQKKKKRLPVKKKSYLPVMKKNNGFVSMTDEIVIHLDVEIYSTDEILSHQFVCPNCNSRGGKDFFSIDDFINCGYHNSMPDDEREDLLANRDNLIGTHCRSCDHIMMVRSDRLQELVSKEIDRGTWSRERSITFVNCILEVI